MKNNERKRLAKGAIMAATLTAGVVGGLSMYNEAHGKSNSAGYQLIICAGGGYGCVSVSSGANCGFLAQCP